MNNNAIQKTVKHKTMVLAVMAALVTQAAWATASGNSVGKISGRQIQMIGVPALVGSGESGTSLAASVPGVTDPENDQLIDWLYQWKVDGMGVAAEASAGSINVIPAYTVQGADVGKTITLCLKALADKGYPLETKTSAAGCSSGVVAKTSAAYLAYPTVPGVGTFVKSGFSAYDWYASNSYCANLSSDGYSDWRLPSMDELLALYNAYPNNQMGTVYGWSTNTLYWSSTVSSVGEHYNVFLYDGNINANEDSYNGLSHVACVR